MRLSTDTSVEITPNHLDHLPTLARLLPPGTAVYITHLPDPGLDGSVAAAAAVADAGLRPVPHIAARALDSLPQLESALHRMRQGAGVDDLLLIAGGLTDPGPFPSTMDLLRTGVLQRHGISRFGVAGHPEGSPDITPDELAAAVAEKNAYARATSSEVRIVTQFTFDPAPVIAWEQQLRVAGNRLPIHVGLPGAATIPTLLRYGLRCGIGPSLTVLRKQSGRFAKLASASPHYPDATVIGIAAAAAQDPGTMFAGFHHFPFGAVERTVSWATELQAGAFHVAADGTLRSPSRR